MFVCFVSAGRLNSMLRSAGIGSEPELASGSTPSSVAAQSRHNSIRRLLPPATHSCLPLPSGQYHRRRATVAYPAFFRSYPPEAAKQGKRFLGILTGCGQLQRPPTRDLARAVLASEAGSVSRSTVKAEGRRDLDVQHASLRNMRRSFRGGHPPECGR